jgi:hypothetical protein
MSISEYNPFTKEYVQVDDYSTKTIPIADSFVTLTGLTPGSCLKVNISALSSSGNVVSGAFFLNPFARVTCGCPSLYLDELAATESTGAPSNLVLTQVFVCLLVIFTISDLRQSVSAMDRPLIVRDWLHL